MTAHECKELGIIDEVVPEPQRGAHTDPVSASEELLRTITRHLADLTKISSKKLVKHRHSKFRNMGEYTSHSQAAVRREVSLLQHIVLKGANGKKTRSKKKNKEEVPET